MRLGTLLFLAYLVIFGLCFSYPISRIAGGLRTRYLESLEEPLVDQANILASIVSRDMEAGRFDPADLGKALDAAYRRRIGARIYEMRKNRVDVQVYITDAAGRVVFDSEHPESVGADYSDWRDVKLTLEGKYGARATRRDPGSDASAVLYVGAPILVGGARAGVLTVAKPTSGVNEFLRTARPQLFRIAAISGLVAVSLSLLVSIWVSRQIGRLTRYANDVREGKRVALPSLARTELRDMGDAVEKMKETLEGRKYVEEYVQTLMHELKSPVSAIRGAAELLEGEMAPADRARFLSNIGTEAGRIEDLVERMLKLSELESKRSLESVELVPLLGLVRSVVEGKRTLLAMKQLALDVAVDGATVVRGDPFLLQLAVSNLLQNAIDFSPAQGRIAIRATAERGAAILTVDDEGPGIPEYAVERIFERFYSLKRPDTGKKSTGLGLNFAREVAVLHRGEIRLENLEPHGARATLSVPVGG